MDILGQTSLLVAVSSFGLGISVLYQNVRNKLFLAFAVFNTVIATWAFAFFLDKVYPEYEIYKLHVLMNIWLAPASLGFIRFLVRIQDGLSRRLLEFSLLGAILLSGALAFDLEQSTEWLRQTMYYWPGLVMLQILRLMWIDRRLYRGEKRAPKVPTVGFARRSLIYGGALFVLSISTMDHIGWAGKVAPAIGNLFLCAYLFLLSQAISQQRLLNFRAIFSRFLVLISLAFILTLFYLLLVAWIEESPALFFLNSFIASLMIIMLLEPIRASIRYFTQRLLTQEHQRLEQALRDAQRQLIGITDPNSLFSAMVLTLKETIEPERISFYVLSGDGTRYRQFRSAEPVKAIATDESEKISGEPAPEPVKELLLGNPLVERCVRLQKKGELPVLLDQMMESEVDRSASRSQKEYFAGILEALKALDCNLLIPLIDAGQVLGLLALRVGGPPEPWGGNWGLLQILYPYFEQAGRTLRNMEIFVRQREKERLAAMGEMAAGLAHEIRNPLGAIKGAAQFLDPAKDRPESRFLGIILEEVDRLNRVVTQFLDYSRPQNPELRLVDLGELAARTIDLLKAGAPRHIEIEYARPIFSVNTMAAPEQIHQILMNLIQNSFKALKGQPRGRVRVTVEDLATVKEVQLIVEDDGPGISAVNMEKLFIPFFTTSPSGTGLGLSISQKIAEAHQGRIEVESEEGQFTRFTVTLPRAPAQ